MVGSALAFAITAAATSMAWGDWDHASFPQATASPVWAGHAWSKQPAKPHGAVASRAPVPVGSLTESQRQVDRLVRELVPLQRALGSRAGAQRKAELRLEALQDEARRAETAFRPLREELRALRAADQAAHGSLRRAEAAAGRSGAEADGGLKRFSTRQLGELMSDLGASISEATLRVADLSGRLKLEQPGNGAGQGTSTSAVVAMTRRRQQRADSLEADLARSKEQYVKLQEDAGAVRADFERLAREKHWLEETAAKATPELQALQEERGRLYEESRRLHEGLAGAQQSEAGQMERERVRLASGKEALQGEIARLSGENKQAELADARAAGATERAGVALKQAVSVNQELKKRVAAAMAEAQRLH